MIHNSPKLLCNTFLFFFLMVTSSIANAQMDLETANVIIAYADEPITESDSMNEDLVLFRESGKGRLTNGSAEIRIDPRIAEQIEGKKIEDLVTVVIQMEGKSNGVYVSKKNKDTFVITELNAGSSNTHFSYNFTVSAPN